MKCDKCQFTGPEGRSHHHIVVETGKVVNVEYISGDGFGTGNLKNPSILWSIKTLGLSQSYTTGNRCASWASATARVIRIADVVGSFPTDPLVRVLLTGESREVTAELEVFLGFFNMCST
jgi:hypothetical protein